MLITLLNDRKCFDCGSSDVEWASVSSGIFICLECAGIHRSFGVSISFVRSIHMDAWTRSQVTNVIDMQPYLF